MARLTKATKNTILASMNEFLIFIDEKEDVELEFGLVDDGVMSKIMLICKKSSTSSGKQRSIEYRDGVIHVN